MLHFNNKLFLKNVVPWMVAIIIIISLLSLLILHLKPFYLTQLEPLVREQTYQLKRGIIKIDRLVLSSNILFSIRTHKYIFIHRFFWCKGSVIHSILFHSILVSCIKRVYKVLFNISSFSVFRGVKI